MNSSANASAWALNGLALGFSLLGAETFSSVYVLMLIALECSRDIAEILDKPQIL
jgi:hypothetical protein